jgi:hypothetical protein
MKYLIIYTYMKKLSTFALCCLCFWAACTYEGDFSAAPETGKSGSITRFAVHGGYMYTLNQNKVATFSLADPEKPLLVHTLPTDYGLETITIYEGTIYIGSRTALYILGLDNPAAPALLSKAERGIEFFNGCDPVVVKGNYAFSTIKIIENICGSVSVQSALLVYDVSDKTNPKEIGMASLSMPNGLGYKDNTLFVCDEGSDELVQFDITDPKNPIKSATKIPILDPLDLIVSGGKMIVSSKTNFEIYDISDLANVRKVSTILK